MSTKNNYLQEENIQLKEQVEALKDMLKLNKQALQIAMNNNPQPATQASQVEQQVSTQPDQPNNEKQSQALNKVISSLYEENNNHLQTIERISQERDLAQSKSLVNQQMYEEMQRQKQEIQEETSAEINGLKRKNMELEHEIHELEKVKPIYDQISGVVVKYREVVGLNSQSIVMHEEIERLNYIIVKQAKEISKLNQNVDDLTKMNFQISSELTKQKAMQYLPNNNNYYHQQVPQPLNNQQQQNFQQNNEGNGMNNNNNILGGLQLNLNKMQNNNQEYQDIEQNINPDYEQLNHLEDQKMQVQIDPQDMMNNQTNGDENPLDKSALLLMNLHKKMMNGDDSDSSSDQDLEEMEKNCLSPMMSPLPDKVQAQQTLATQAQVPGVKQLDLTRAFQIQDINAKRSTMLQLQKEGGERNLDIIKEKAKKLEQQLNDSRKNLAREMLQNKTLQLENEEMKSTLNDLESKNDILINSNSLYEQKWRDIFHAYEFYKDFYKDVIDGRESGSPLRSKNSQSTIQLNAEKIIRERKRRDKTITKSIMDPLFNPFEHIQQEQQQIQQDTQRKELQQQYNETEKKQAKDYLLGMAADLYNYMSYAQNNVNYNKNSDPTNRRARANSNPLDYIPNAVEENIVIKRSAQQKQTVNIQPTNRGGSEYKQQEENNVNKSSIPINQYSYGNDVKNLDDMDN